MINAYQDVCLSAAWSLDKENLSANQLREQLGVSPREYFLFVGAIEPKKNMARLLEGYLSANVQQKLIVVGPLAWKSEKEKALLEQYPERVIYLRYVSSDMLSTLLRHARALVFPSLFEGFGVAMGGISLSSEIAGGAAYLVDPYNVGEIAAAIHRLSNDDALCASLSEKSKERVKYFSSEAYAKRLESVYA